MPFFISPDCLHSNEWPPLVLVPLITHLLVRDFPSAAWRVENCISLREVLISIWKTYFFLNSADGWTWLTRCNIFIKNMPNWIREKFSWKLCSCSVFPYIFSAASCLVNVLPVWLVYTVSVVVFGFSRMVSISRFLSYRLSRVYTF